MCTDPWYSPIRMPDGKSVSGFAAFAHRVKLLGGPTPAITRAVFMVLQEVNTTTQSPATHSNIIQFPKAA